MSIWVWFRSELSVELIEILLIYHLSRELLYSLYSAFLECFFWIESRDD
jgi:hypothetical protein